MKKPPEVVSWIEAKKNFLQIIDFLFIISSNSYQKGIANIPFCLFFDNFATASSPDLTNLIS